MPVDARLHVVDRPNLISVTFEEPRRALSNAILSGGLRWVRNWICASVPGDYARMDPANDLTERADRIGLRGTTLGMLTAVDVATRHIVVVGPVSVVATVGVGHAAQAGGHMPKTPDSLLPAACGQSTAPIGTINILVSIDGQLTDRTLVEAMAVAVEAKVIGLTEANIVSSSGESATGTPSDAIALVAGGKVSGHPHLFAGTSTALGGAIGTAVRTAVRLGAVADRAGRAV